MDSRELLSDFRQALSGLQAALREPVVSDVVKAGCIQFFEFTFELAWKTVKRFAEEDGAAECNTPRAALKAAFGSGWLDKEDLWLDMLASRNRMAHTYHAADALQVFDRLPAYAAALELLAARLSSLAEGLVPDREEESR